MYAVAIEFLASVLLLVVVLLAILGFFEVLCTDAPRVCELGIARLGFAMLLEIVVMLTIAVFVYAIIALIIRYYLVRSSSESRLKYY